MANSRDVEIDIVGQDRTRNATRRAGQNFDELGRRIEGASRRSQTMSQRLLSGAKKLQPAAQAIGVALVALGADAIRNASNTQESIGATQTVFGKYSKDIIAKSQNERDNVRLTANEYREAANLIGSTLRNQGVASDKLGGKTKAMIQTGADLAATFGGSTKEAVEALGSAFKGEYDPIERYGIGLSASKIQSEAFNVAGVETAKQFGKLSDKAQAQAKQQATTNLIMKQAGKAAGAAGRESKNTAAQVEAMKEKYGNLSSELGTKLLPIVSKVLEAGIATLKWMTKHKPVVVALATAVGILTGAILLMNLAFLANPVGLAVLAFAALAAGLVYLWQKSQTARNIMTTAFAAIVSAILQGARLMLQAYKAITDGILSTVETVLRALGKIPGNGWAKKAADQVHGYKTSADKAFNGAIQKTKDWEKAVNTLPKIVKLKGDIQDLSAKIATAKAKLKEKGLTNPEKTKLRADIAQLLAAKKRAQDAINALHGKTVTVKVMTLEGHPGKQADNRLDATEGWGQTIGGAGYRTGGASGVQMGDTIVDSRIYLDGSILDSRTNTIVRQNSDRSAYRARIGRR